MESIASFMYQFLPTFCCLWFSLKYLWKRCLGIINPVQCYNLTKVSRASHSCLCSNFLPFIFYLGLIVYNVILVLSHVIFLTKLWCMCYPRLTGIATEAKWDAPKSHGKPWLASDLNSVLMAGCPGLFSCYKKTTRVKRFDQQSGFSNTASELHREAGYVNCTIHNRWAF